MADENDLKAQDAVDQGEAAQKQPPETNKVTTKEDAKKELAAQKQAEQDAAKAQADADAADEDAADDGKSEKKKTYYARLVRGQFIQAHSRAGYTFDVGPNAIEVELTKAEKQEMDEDAGIEFLKKKDAQLIDDNTSAVDGVQGDNGRVYE